MIFRAAVTFALTAALAACSDSKVQQGSPTPSAVAGPADPSRLEIAARHAPLIAHGESAYAAGNIDSARAIWTQALAGVRAAGDTPGEARVLTSLGLAAYRLGDYAQARQLGERALALKIDHSLTADLFKSYNALGLLAWNEGRLRDAIALYGKATAIARSQGDQASLAKAANNIGLVHAELGDFAQARAGFEAGHRAALELNDTLIQGRTLTNIGMLDIEIGDPGAAVPRLLRAQALSRAVADATGEQNTLGQLGSAYERMGEHSLALAALDGALALSREQGLRQDEASNLEVLAGLHREAGRHRHALRLYREANVINRELGLEVERGTSLRNSAEILSVLGRTDLAKDNAKVALRIHRATGARAQEIRDLLLLADLESGPGGSETVARQWMERAESLSTALGARTARADVALGKALIAERAERFADVLTTLRGARADISAGGYRSEWAASAMMARAYAGLSQLDSAAAEGKRAITAVERVRGSFGSGALRASFLSDKSGPYADLVDVLLRQGRVSQAFEISDAARNRALIENSAAVSRMTEGATGTIRAVGNGEATLRQIETLVALLDAIEETPLSERSAEAHAQVRSLTAELSAARSSYEALLVRVSDRDSSGSVMLGTSHRSTRDVQRSLGPDEALVEFLLTAKKIVVFVATSTQLESVTQNVARGDVERRVRTGLDLLGRRSTPSATRGEVLAGLRSLLIAPAEGTGLLRGARRLIIVPHGALAYVPFAALRKGKAGRYLVEDYSLMYLPSAGALPVLRSESRLAAVSGGVMQPVAFAPFTRELPGSLREARAFARGIPGAQSVVGPDATERRVRDALARSTVVHIATHGVMNPRNPMFSRVALARGSGAPDDDGRLEMHELLGLRVGARLVFLSGCETALGVESQQQGAGEDYATLAQAFLYAGASSVAATLWRIGDEGAADLATRFYSKLATMDASDALAGAQRELLRGERFASPYYWAAYQLSGADPAVPHRKRVASVPLINGSFASFDRTDR